MLFLNSALLFGLAAIAVPIALHFLNRRSAKAMPWGAMQFLRESVASRTRNIELEDALLMAARCLAVALPVLAIARPFSPPGSPVPWAVVLPAMLLAVATLGAGCALWSNRRRRWLLLGISGLLFATVTAAVLFEHRWNLRRLGGGAEQDVALIIDASTSMGADFGRGSQFERAVGEARAIIHGASPATAFSLILAGPSPQVLTPRPTRSRPELDRLLASAQVADGGVSAPGALRAAAGELAKGELAGKRTVFLTDDRGSGWDAADEARWGAAAEPHTEFGGDKPQLVLRRLDSPSSVRNLTVSEIRFGRDAVGTDRPVEIEVTLANTGTEAVTPGGVQLRVGDVLLEDDTLGQLVPGMKQTVRFSHHFETPGGHAVTARALVEDHVADDDSAAAALVVRDDLRALIIDGNPGGRYFDRASAFLELALAPGLADGAPAAIEPVVLPAPAVLSLTSLDRYDAVVLADVPRLPASVAALLGQWVEGGGGLLIAPGGRADPSFYNAWQTGPSARLCPATLDAWTEVPADADAPPTIAPATFDHRALRKAADPERGDLATVRASAYWRLGVPGGGDVRLVAKWNTGEPVFALRHRGAGTVWISSIPFDTSASNLPTCTSFLVLVHELLSALAAPEGGSLNLPPSADLALRLPVPRPPEGTAFGVLGPRGDASTAEPISGTGGGGTLFQIGAPPLAGLYEMEIPATGREPFAPFLSPAGTVPFTVARPIEEASLTPLSRADLAKVAVHFDLIEAGDTDDVLTVLAGKSFGEELWRSLAVGALLIWIAEAALARWVARSRKLGATAAVGFSGRRRPGERFEAGLADLRGDPAPGSSR